ncbi:MarR family transcriptional regulator [Paenibacillus oenotherae]|uniref:MarR family transcriptional regulator n=1 Tax=Paenibacillus oenotherae TaxID=1435645 RepID=A0ABS7CZY2_9BACL|nr:MarR family transcriptional regulator [Paenibacillus oenotherae]MBW7473130.1 MarR family transcriptional regulator [Paenibacillus oenotherae]
MITKRCLFCDQIVPVNSIGDYDRYEGCYCAPGSSYNLRNDSYIHYNSLSYQNKRQMFPILSAYIRELTDLDERVMITFEDLEGILNSPAIPTTIEEKSQRLLQYLFKRSRGPLEPVVIHQLSQSYNLTYSPNLQELIYIIEKLREEEYVERVGATFKLTESGWKEASMIAGGKRLQPCVVIVADDEQWRQEWSEKVVPMIEQCGYTVRMADNPQNDAEGDGIMQLIAESKLIIADLTGQDQEIYFAAGYALGLQIPLLCTVNKSDAEQLPLHSKEINPIIWGGTEELTAILEQRLR